MIFSRLLLQRSVACILLTAVSTGLAQTTATEYFNQAALKQQRGDLDGAIADYKRAIALASNPSPASITESYPGERFPQTRTRLLTQEEIGSWTQAKIRYAINEIFARRGAAFREKSLAKWFGQFTWYRPNPNTTFDQIENSLSEVEKQNVKLLGYVRDTKQSARR